MTDFNVEIKTIGKRCFKEEELIKEQIQNNLQLRKTQFPNQNKLKLIYSGKVRDVYSYKDEQGEDILVLITTDRQSAFDRILAAIPFKGQVLNQISEWWFNETEHIIKNHIYCKSPDPNIILAKPCNVFPIEFIVRGYMTGSTDTSIWTHYKNASRKYCGHTLPDGLRKNQILPNSPILTPTTKDIHDCPISDEEIIKNNLMSKEDWDIVSMKALELFAYGQKKAYESGLILVDTKYEFGKLKSDGSIVLIDEIHTPDSSRYWIADTYEKRFAEGKEPENIDKEFLRLWFRKNCDPYKNKILPEAPHELVAELSRRYIYLYELITKSKFKFPIENEKNKRCSNRIIFNLNRL